MRWPWQSRETRSTSYTDLIVQGLVAQAESSEASDLLATVEAACGLWERSFAAGRSSVLTGPQLAMAGRSLLLSGESVWWRSRGSGLWPVHQWDVRGKSPAQSRWSYKLQLSTPDGSITKSASAAQVVHVRIGSRPERPWEGSSPLVNSQATRDALKQIENSLKNEHAGPTGSLLPAPDPESEDLQDALLKLKGKVLLVEHSELGLGGEGQQGRTRWTPRRLGPEPQDGTIQARAAMQLSLLQAAGIPPAMVDPSATANASREALRQFLWTTISPAMRLVSGELERIGLDPNIDLAGLNASDLAGRTRSYKQLVEAGMSADDAARLTGLE